MADRLRLTCRIIKSDMSVTLKKKGGGGGKDMLVITIIEIVLLEFTSNFALLNI